MKLENVTRNWEKRQSYKKVVEKSVKVPNLKRAARFGESETDKAIRKYGIDNYVAQECA